MSVNIQVRRFAQGDTGRTLLHTTDPHQRAVLEKSMRDYYAKLKTNAQEITEEDLEKLLRPAFQAYRGRTARSLDIIDQYKFFKGKHVYDMPETHPDTKHLKHQHAKAWQELGEVAEPLNNLRALLANYNAEKNNLNYQIHKYSGNPEDAEVLELAARLTRVEDDIKHAESSILEIQKHVQSLDANINTIEINLNQLEALGGIANSAAIASSISSNLDNGDVSRNIKVLQTRLEAAAELTSETPDEKALTNLMLVEKVKKIKAAHNA